MQANRTELFMVDYSHRLLSYASKMGSMLAWNETEIQKLGVATIFVHACRSTVQVHLNSTCMHVREPTCTVIRIHSSPSLIHNLKLSLSPLRYREPATQSCLRK